MDPETAKLLFSGIRRKVDFVCFDGLNPKLNPEPQNLTRLVGWEQKPDSSGLASAPGILLSPL